ncbi:Uncharacterised protein [Salmonella enterica subsp. enterica serovar Typhimurium str. DT104]|nr:Uncharacterised protein [Salmonella enterica subsp. enterica serovar Typhimurium str. DT104]
MFLARQRIFFHPAKACHIQRAVRAIPRGKAAVLVRGDKPFDLRQHAFIFLVGNMAALVQPGVQADLHRLIRRAFLPARDAVQRRYLSGRRQQGKTGHDALHLVSSVVRHQGVLVAAK